MKTGTAAVVGCVLIGISLATARSDDAAQAINRFPGEYKDCSAAMIERLMGGK